MTVAVDKGVAVEGGACTGAMRARCTKGCSDLGKGNGCESRWWYWSVCSGLRGAYEHGSGYRRWAGMAGEAAWAAAAAGRRSPINVQGGGVPNKAGRRATGGGRQAARSLCNARVEVRGGALRARARAWRVVCCARSDDGRWQCQQCCRREVGRQSQAASAVEARV